VHIKLQTFKFFYKPNCRLFLLLRLDVLYLFIFPPIVVRLNLELDLYSSLA